MPFSPNCATVINAESGCKNSWHKDINSDLSKEPIFNKNNQQAWLFWLNTETEMPSKLINDYNCIAVWVSSSTKQKTEIQTMTFCRGPINKVVGPKLTRFHWLHSLIIEATSGAFLIKDTPNKNQFVNPKNECTLI